MNNSKPILEEALTEALQQNGIHVIDITSITGPAYTLYKITPESGVKVSQLRALSGKLKDALNVKSLRVVTREDGIGIEINNPQQTEVKASSFLSSEEFKKARETMELPVAVGMKVDGKVEVLDLAKMPHLLIAGETEENVSMVMHNIAMSIMSADVPGYAHFVIIGNRENNLKINKNANNPFMARVPESEEKENEAEYMLQTLVAEMDKRYAELAEMKCNNIYELRDKFTFKREDCIHEFYVMPCIVVLIDEYADFISGKGELPQRILGLILLLASRGRRVGIHLVISTSCIKPSIISGIIKANFPARIALKVGSSSASKLILDTAGAETLMEQNDALVETDKGITRVQIGSLEVKEIAVFIDAALNVPCQTIPYKLPVPNTKQHKYNNRNN